MEPDLSLAALTTNLEDVSAIALAWAAEFIPRFVSAILILAIGLFVAGWASRTVRNLAGRSKRVGSTLPPVLGAVVRYAILVLVFVAVLGQLGVQTASILAALGAAGLAIGLALQGTLQNIAAGIMILWLRPFQAGDVIETDKVMGTVEELNLFHSQVRTWEGLFKFVPNSELWNTVLTNYTRNPTRLVRITFGVSYDDDIETAQRILKETAEADPRVQADPLVQIVPLQLADSSVNLEMRAWATTAEFWAVRWDLTVRGKKALEGAGVTIPFPQLVLHRSAAEADLSA